MTTQQKVDHFFQSFTAIRVLAQAVQKKEKYDYDKLLEALVPLENALNNYGAAALFPENEHHWVKNTSEARRLRHERHLRSVG